jgi:carbon storage regulator
MLVLSRKQGESVGIGAFDDSSILTIVTVQKLLHARRSVAVLVEQKSFGQAPMSSRIIELESGKAAPIADEIELELVDLRGESARIGIRAPKELSVHRLEVYEAIRRERRRGDDHGPDGLAGSRVPRPPSPKPPGLDVRLDEPRSDDEDGG